MDWRKLMYKLKQIEESDAVEKIKQKVKLATQAYVLKLTCIVLRSDWRVLSLTVPSLDNWEEEKQQEMQTKAIWTIQTEKTVCLFTQYYQMNELQCSPYNQQMKVIMGYIK